MQVSPDRIRFPLNSEQCELLVAFEQAGSLPELSKLVHKDPSALSRNLTALAESGVLEKRGNRWVLTPLGRQINAWTRAVASTQKKILSQQGALKLPNASLPALGATSALLVVGAQNGWDDPSWGGRNNPHAERHIADLLAAWRAQKRPVYHVQHQSRSPVSPLRPGTVGAEFKPCGRPAPGEDVIKKSANGAFAGTELEKLLRERGHDTLVVAGFTTNHCVDATVRAAGDFGFTTFVVSDACVAFDRAAPDGAVVKAEDTHRAVMANLNQEFATVVDAATLMQIEPVETI